MKISYVHIIGILALISPLLAVFSPLGLAPLIGICGFCVILLTIREKNIGSLVSTENIMLFGTIIIWTGLSVFWAVDSGSSALKFVRFFAIVLVGLAMISTAKWVIIEEQHYLARLFLIGVLTGLFLLFFERGTEGFFSNLFGIKVQYHTFNRSATLFALLAWPAALMAQRYKRWGALSLFLLILLLTGLLGSRSALLAMILGLAAFILTKIQPKLAISVVGFISISYILMGPFFHTQILSPDKIKINANELSRQYIYFPRSTYHRFLIWNFSSRKALEKPIFGWGYRSSRSIPGAKKMLDQSEEALPLHPHNGVIQIWLELGFIGALVAAFLSFKIIRKLWRKAHLKKEAAYALGLYSSSFTMICISYGLWQSWWLAGLFIAATIYISSENEGIVYKKQ